MNSSKTLFTSTIFEMSLSFSFFLEEFFEENSYYELEEHGWMFGDCEMIIDCDMIIEKLDEEGNPTGEIYKTEEMDDEK